MADKVHFDKLIKTHVASSVYDELCAVAEERGEKPAMTFRAAVYAFLKDIRKDSSERSAA